MEAGMHYDPVRGGALPPNLLSASPRDVPIAEAKGTSGASGAVV